MKLKKVRWLALFFFIAISLGAGLIGSLFTFSAIPTWYAMLTKPVFSPPNWVFGPVWTILYILMGTSAYLIWQKSTTKKIAVTALQFFAVQLVLNALWSIIFFGLKNPSLAFLEIIMLWGTIVLTLQKFRRIDTYAAYLLFPYLAWVSFAALLNLAVALLN